MPTRFRTQKPAPFATLARNKRRNAVVRLGWKIARLGGGREFWTDHLMDDPADPQHVHHWVDLCFLGTDRFTLWNAEFITTQVALQDAVHDRAFNAVYAQLSPEDIAQEFAMSWQSVPRKHPAAERTKVWLPQPDRLYPQFEGRSFNQECDQLEAHYLATDPPAVGEKFTLDHRYRYGIGLQAVVDEANLDVAAIERTIQRFRDVGEQDWLA
jgi:hypothetical protein